MKILVGDKPPNIKEAGVGPIRCHEEIRGTRTGLQACGPATSSCIAQVCPARWKLGTKRNRCLRGSPRGIPPVETVFYEHHRIAHACSSDRHRAIARRVEVVRYHWQQHGQIKIAIEAPDEVEITFV